MFSPDHIAESLPGEPPRPAKPLPLFLLRVVAYAFGVAFLAVLLSGL